MTSSSGWQSRRSEPRGGSQAVGSSQRGTTRDRDDATTAKKTQNRSDSTATQPLLRHEGRPGKPPSSHQKKKKRSEAEAN
uniref:Uncharacterized protein n=1 Tax=Oryza punctata TaxID=4537 RepID=A0A0E0JSL3_ORYPU